MKVLLIILVGITIAAVHSANSAAHHEGCRLNFTAKQKLDFYAWKVIKDLLFYCIK